MILIPKFNRTIKTIINGLFLLSILLAQPLRQVRPEAVGMSSDRLDRLTQQMESYVLENQLSGGVTLVLRHGKIAYFDAFGYRDTESKDNMEIDDIFRIASQTKAMISVGIMILQEKGQLLISDPVGKYIPKYNSTTVAVKTEDGYKVVPANRQITIRDLLTHTAGVGWGFGPGGDQWKKADIIGWYFAHRKTSIQSTVNQISSLPMDAQPGERFVYGLSTDILGALIEVVSGQPLDKFLQKEIFNPLEMTDTHFYLPVNKHHRLSTVYSSTENGIALSPNPGKRIGAGMIGQGHYINGPRKSFSG
ncbi:MAG: serine hydrolase domain-containing protein, partial [Candidatus Marinimicrobia bacterium]|nr:serine hydrolase domain-containing protein [Candidatus Neomarinimicrobiota bacterium]